VVVVAPSGAVVDGLIVVAGKLMVGPVKGGVVVVGEVELRAGEVVAGAGALLVGVVRWVDRATVVVGAGTW
jgi:hypothetical protein